MIVAEAELAIAAQRTQTRSGDPIVWDDLLSAAHELQRLGMPPTEIHRVLVTDDPEIIRRHMELQRERLQERIADEVATVGRIESSLSEAIRARTLAMSAMTLVAGDETREPYPSGALPVEAEA